MKCENRTEGPPFSIFDGMDTLVFTGIRLNVCEDFLREPFWLARKERNGIGCVRVFT